MNTESKKTQVRKSMCRDPWLNAAYIYFISFIALSNLQYVLNCPHFTHEATETQSGSTSYPKSHK